MGIAREKASLMCTLGKLSHELLGIDFERVTTKEKTKNDIMDIIRGKEYNTFYVEVNLKWLLNTDNKTIILVLLQKFRLIYQQAQIINLTSNVESLKYIEDKNLILVWEDEMNDIIEPMVTKHIFIDSLAYAKLICMELYGIDVDVPNQIINETNKRMFQIKSFIINDLNEIKRNLFKMTLLTKYVKNRTNIKGF